ncbi:MAG: phosphatase PAP2 family protein [Candidatus Deferrimicrobiaceae bacterium]
MLSGSHVRSFRCPVLVVLFLFLASSAFAGSDGMDTAGNVGTVLIPAVAAGATLAKKDGTGGKQLFLSLLAAAAVTEGLNAVVHERGPDGRDHSFPSGHTSISFAAASYMQFRYGWRYGIPAFLAAAFVGYSRVEADEHWTKDVLGGAAIGIVSGWIFTSRYRKEPGRVFIVPAIGRNSAAIALGLGF